MAKANPAEVPQGLVRKSRLPDFRGGLTVIVQQRRSESANKGRDFFAMAAQHRKHVETKDYNFGAGTYLHYVHNHRPKSTVCQLIEQGCPARCIAR
jgi:hypothetical protein